MKRFVPAMIVLAVLPVGALVGHGIGWFLNATATTDAARMFAVAVLAVVFLTIGLGIWLGVKGASR